MKTIYFLVVLTMFPLASDAQYDANFNKMWAFGYKAGLDFNSGSPVAITTGFADPNFTEGGASVCDAFGNLLFYTNGTDVYNKNHVLMPNGTAIASFPTFSTSQSSVIAPVIDSPGMYYIFSLQQGTPSDTATCRLEYCKVNMALAGGLGDVVATSKKVFLADSLAEKMVVVTGNNHNIWLLVHRKDTALFLAFEIASSGINTDPVLSATGTFTSRWGYGVGVMKVSPNRRRIVTQTRYQNVSSFMQKYGTEVYDFNPTTGKASTCLVLDSTNSQYGAEFSADNTKLYTNQVSGYDTMNVYQYDLALSDVATIRASKTFVAQVRRTDAADLKLAPDKKIYFISTDTVQLSGPRYLRYLDCISFPDSVGTSCGYVYRAIKLATGTGAHLGLPNLYVTADTVIAPVEVAGVKAMVGCKFYPNPVSDVLNVNVSRKIESLCVFSLNGKKIMDYSFNDDEAKIDVSILPAGLYVIRVNGVFNELFLKK